MKLKFTRKTWYFFLLAAAAVSMLGGFAVLGGMDFSGLEMIVFCLTGIAVLFLAAQKGAPAREKRNYTGVFVVLMLSKLGASGWAGDICSALVWPALLATEYERGRPIQRQLQLVSAAEVLRLVFWMLTKYAGMSGLAFWTNIMFVLLTCARGWAGLTLYKTQEETLCPSAAGRLKPRQNAALAAEPFWLVRAQRPVRQRGGTCGRKAMQTTLPPQGRIRLRHPTPPCPPESGGRCG